MDFKILDNNSKVNESYKKNLLKDNELVDGKFTFLVKILFCRFTTKLV